MFLIRIVLITANHHTIHNSTSLADEDSLPLSYSYRKKKLFTFFIFILNARKSFCCCCFFLQHIAWIRILLSIFQFSFVHFKWKMKKFSAIIFGHFGFLYSSSFSFRCNLSFQILEFQAFLSSKLNENISNRMILVNDYSVYGFSWHLKRCKIPRIREIYIEQCRSPTISNGSNILFIGRDFRVFITSYISFLKIDEINLIQILLTTKVNTHYHHKISTTIFCKRETE